jgi:hypothetical protein
METLTAVLSILVDTFLRTVVEVQTLTFIEILTCSVVRSQCKSTVTITDIAALCIDTFLCAVVQSRAGTFVDV